ncbi:MULTISPECIES: amino acid ABC transporter permease [Labrys]|uniref:Amino acid ABC transporter permease n=1 Tax=Labrys neptuniae TaxID=376174 RepID=A0ABV3PSP8_9HYPH
MFSLNAFVKSFHALALGVPSTLIVSLLGIAIGLLVGALICAGALSLSPVLRRVAAVWISFFRGVPLMVQLLLMFYLLPVAGINVPPMVAAVLAVGLCSSAYVAEIWRGAINALPRGQAEAAVAIGMLPRSIWTRIILPQAVRLSLPALVNELILLVKASSLVSLVGIWEITRASQAEAGASYRPLEAYVAAGCLYLVINLCLAALGRYLERRTAA